MGITGHEPWFNESAPLEPKHKTMIVIGAGFAGTSVAYEAQLRGWKVTIIERSNHIGMGASGNPVACLYPAIASEENTSVFLSELGMSRHRENFAKANADHSQNFIKGRDYDDSGVVALCGKDNEEGIKLKKRYQKAASVFPDRYQFLSKNDLSTLAGTRVPSDGLLLKNAGWLNPRRYLEFSTKNIHVSLSTSCLELIKIKSGWSVRCKGSQGEFTLESEAVVVCSGYEANNFEQLNWLRTFPVAGQVDCYATTVQSSALKYPICYEGYVSPAVHDGLHVAGATFRMGSSDCAVSTEDSHTIKGHLSDLIESNDLQTVAKSRVSVRSTSPDATPVVGFVVDKSQFLDCYKTIHKGYAESTFLKAPSHTGLYVITGLGARGALFAPAAAHLLLKYIHGELSNREKIVLSRINASRYLLRDIIRSNQ